MSQESYSLVGFMTREQAAEEFGVTVNQLRHMARRGEIHNFRRGRLRTIWLKRSELEEALRLHIISPDEDDEDGDEEE